MQILKGGEVSRQIQSEIQQELTIWNSKGVSLPHLSVILVGNDPASEIYVEKKQQMCHKLGYTSEIIRMPKEASLVEVSQKIESLNQNKSVDGILVQLPLPAHLNARQVLECISPEKDVDCLTEKNLGRLLTNQPVIKPCTPSGIIEILNYYKISLAGKNIAVVGRSLIVGTPLFHLFLKENATVTVFHSKSEDMHKRIKEFDIVCVAVGKLNLFKYSDFKEGAVVIDVGMNRTADGLFGDVQNDSDLKSNSLKAATPVPGGVGLMTIAMLMKNTLTLAKRRRSI